MMEKIIELLKEKTITVPRILFQSYREFKLTEQEFVFIIYLWNENDKLFNPKKIGEDLGYSLNEVLEIVNNIASKDCLEIKVVKNGSKVEEHISFEELYKKLAFFIVNGKPVQEEAKKTNVYDAFEQEFGRTLSSMEYEIIGGWLDGEFTEEVVLLALKEAVYNGVFNLRYIDKILYEWKKKGIHSKEDIEREKKSFMERKQEPKELFDYEWLNDRSE